MSLPHYTFQLSSHVRLPVLFALLVTVVSPVIADQEYSADICVAFTSQPVASLGAISVTQKELDARVMRVPEKDRTQFISNRTRIGELLEQLLLQRGAYIDALAEDDFLDDGLINAQLYDRIIEFIGEHRVERYIESRLLDDYTKRAREIYLSERDIFRTPRRYDFTHVLIQPGSEDEAIPMRKILALHDRIENGESIETLAVEYSDDPTVDENQGSYEKMLLEDLDRNFANALRRLEPGEISGPVRSRFGWHVIRFDDVHEREHQSWEDAADQARQMARRRHEDRLRRQYNSDILASAPIEVVPGAIEALQRRYGYDPETGMPTGSE